MEKLQELRGIGKVIRTAVRRGEGEREMQGKKKKENERKKTRNCARRKRERGISWVSIVNGYVYGEYDRALKTWIDKSLYL